MSIDMPQGNEEKHEEDQHSERPASSGPGDSLTEPPPPPSTDDTEAPVSTDHEPSDGASEVLSRKEQQGFVPRKGWADLAEQLAQCKTEAEKELLLSQLTELADAIWKIVEAKRANDDMVPKGMLTRVGFELGIGQDKVDRLVRRMEAHDIARKQGQPVGPRVNAVISGKAGRQAGKRDFPDEVQTLIIDRWRTAKAESLDRHGATEPINVHLTRKMVFRWFRKVRPNLKISRASVYRIIDDFQNSEQAKDAWARGRKNEVRDNLQTVDVDFLAPNHFWIADIRPLPIRSEHKGILCTVGLLQIIEAFSTRRLRMKILPRKDVNEQGEVFGVDFTCKEVRLQIALAILTYGVRPRSIYVDNGAQFGKALEKFIDLLTPDGADPTIIIHSEPYSPRGRGVIERALGLIDGFIQYKPGYFSEKSYYEALKKPKNHKYLAFKALEEEFSHYHPIWNELTPEGGLSPDQRYVQGPNHGLPPPPELQLGLFTGSIKRDTRMLSREGITIDKVKYVAADDSPEMGTRLVKVTLSKKKRRLLIIDIGDLRFLYVNLDDTGWVPFIKKSERRLSASKQSQWKRDVEASIEADQDAAERRLQLAVLNDLGQKLVVDPYRPDWDWIDQPENTSGGRKRNGAKVTAGTAGSTANDGGQASDAKQESPPASTPDEAPIPAPEDVECSNSTPQDEGTSAPDGTPGNIAPTTSAPNPAPAPSANSPEAQPLTGGEQGQTGSTMSRRRQRLEGRREGEGSSS